MIRVVLADDQTVVRMGFRVLLEEHGDIEVVGEASGGLEAIDVVRRQRPDVVLMDLRMPGGDGIAATREITSWHGVVPGGRETAVLVVTTFDLDEDVFGALEAGADGFVLKDCEPEELVDAVRRLAAGDGLVDASVTRRVITEFARRRPRRPGSPNTTDLLTPRELDIVRLLARGMSNVEISRELFVETSTVKSHLTRAMTKIGARDRVQTVVWAHRNGLAEDD
ncbi:response regulator transcription factor [Brachybacterium alimentarium]|uniref:response regulator transcription factor n=3 Tax=Brachybacterium alimentarium TaxID=47845 RepID=UPI000DF2156A|nr:response regulator transcription factor [Brachybacterium alimentarium]RCS65231.1 DNA-binding response regulator [Brachybacterium alimentarium]RCS79705.1 DNA-binding response regulator [Brachybacterium alimentarium]RCS85314.1 DNA-binding response regulator [Brachybacterium alimentarium]